MICKRTYVLLAIAMLIISIQLDGAACNFPAQRHITNDSIYPPQSLAQYAFDRYQVDGIDACIAALDEYADSKRFYLSSNELYNALHVIYRNNRQSEGQNYGKV